MTRQRLLRYVIWRLHRHFRERRVQPYGAFPASTLAGEEIEEARRVGGR